ncbi:TniQ family protein [Flavobacterium sp.]|uniref:TniQ family protein n=1 Tax=Flavobacterium sp. TaxID=239 RepID=UPI00260B2075|nr:TniQ family protein [Flavobacterium sp.]
MIYISKIRRNIWPLYVHPLPDELFSSWICRLANNHRVSPEILINESLNKKSPIKININNIDIEPEPNIIDIITKNTPIKIEELTKLFLTDYESNIVENNIPEEILFSLLFLNINDPKKSKRRIVFCPNCLAKGTPYFRKKWMLTTSIVCCECKSYLIDHCPSCYKPFSYWNSNKNSIQINYSITTCKCGCDISKFSFPFRSSKLEIDYQNYIDFTINNGFNDHTQYSFTYLNVLIFTASMIKNIIKASRNKKKLFKVYPDVIMDIKVPSNKWTLSDRQHLLPIAFYLLQDFPNRIRYVFPKKYNLKREFGQLPYWFEKELLYR